MSSYTENKFKDLSEERQVRVILDLIYKIEQHWEEPEKNQLIDLFKNYFQWLNIFESQQPIIKKIALP